MASTNDITGDRLVSKGNTKAYDDGYDRIFGNKDKVIPDGNIPCGVNLKKKKGEQGD